MKLTNCQVDHRVNPLGFALRIDPKPSLSSLHPWQPPCFKSLSPRLLKQPPMQVPDFYLSMLTFENINQILSILYLQNLNDFPLFFLRIKF